MNAAAFRHLYEYHFTANRKIWDELIAGLPQDKFAEETDYSVGSVRNQVVHLFTVDDRCFSGWAQRPSGRITCSTSGAGCKTAAQRLWSDSVKVSTKPRRARISR